MLSVPVLVFLVCYDEAEIATFLIYIIFFLCCVFRNVCNLVSPSSKCVFSCIQLESEHFRDANNPVDDRAVL